MNRYLQNAKWLTYLAPLRELSISAAYLTPFFLQKGLSLSEIFLLQSIFSVAVLLCEIPSGYLADKIGRARSIKLSLPIGALALIAYGFSDQYWQFVALELVMAVAASMVSGADTALLVDSLRVADREADYVKHQRRIDAYGFAGTALGVPVAIALAHYVGISATLVADGVLTGLGLIFALRLTEAPRTDSQEEIRLSAWHAMRQLGRNVEARWLIALGAVLSTATYLAFWLAAPYYQALGIPVVWFAAILALRSLWKAGLAHGWWRDWAWLQRRPRDGRELERQMVRYAILASGVYLAMATQQPWLAWAVLGHDAVQALHRQPITGKLNLHITHHYRATINSLVNLVQRLMYAAAGPLVGVLADQAGLPTAFVVTGAVCGAFAAVALARLHRLGTFRDR